MVPSLTTALTVARTDLIAAIRAVLSPQVLPADRIHPYQPPAPATPLVWAGPLSMAPDSLDGTIPVVTLTGSLFAPVDGDTTAQIAACDVLAPALWQAVDTVATVVPPGATVGYIDVGGPQLFGVTLTFQMVVAINSLCPLELITPEVTP